MSLERAWVAILAVAGINALGSPVFHLPAQAALILFALARVQALAAEAMKTVALEERAHDHWRAPTPTMKGPFDGTKRKIRRAVRAYQETQ